MAALATLLIAAADKGQGRGNDASGIGGAAILVGIIILVVIGLIVAYIVVSRMQRTRRGGTAPDEPHPPGRVGRI
jgi:hypothetical protein